MDKLIIRNRNHTILVDFNDIFSLKAMGRYTQVITRSEKHVSCKNLGNLELELPDYFYRIHDSHAVNLNYAGKIMYDEVVMFNGEVFKIAKNRRKKFSEYLRNLCNNHKSVSNNPPE